MPKRTLQYETYDPAKEGYGNPEQWRRAFNSVITGSTSTIEEARLLLGIPSTETNPKVIQKRYWELAKQAHAQCNQGGDHNAFDKVTEAYRVVKENLGLASPQIIIPTAATVTPITPKQPSIFLPQLLNEITEDELERYFTDPDFCAQEKHDGRRRMLKFLNGTTYGYNKKGELRDCLAQFNTELKILMDITHHTEVVLDGEEVDDIYNPFDILFCEGDWRNKIYSERWTNNFLIESAHIKPVFTAYSEKEKRELFEYLKANKKEGIVFKRISGRHLSGYSDDQVKYKFYATASVVVLKHNVQDSIGIGVVSNGEIIPIGNVTMIGHIKPPLGSIVEVKYLYIKRGGRLYQPSYLGDRDDQAVSDCTIEKLKFKD